MPYTLPAEQAAVRENIKNVMTPGDMVFLLTVAILKTYISHPKFETIHALKKDFVVDPKHNEFLQKLRGIFAHAFTTADVYTCAALAYDEFARRVVSAHEDKKALLNQDLPEFAEALALIEVFKAPAPAVEEITTA